MAYLEGFWVEKPHPKSSDFVIAKVSLNVEKLAKAINERGDKFINLQIKESKEGKFYAEIDEWKPESKENWYDNNKKDEDFPF